MEEIRTDKLTFLCIKEATGAKFSSPEDVYGDMKAEAKIDRECMWVLHLNGANKVVEKELVAMGKGNAAIVTPREIYRRAIIKGTVQIIMIHNHPSGDATPSEADKQICYKFKDAGELLGVRLLDFMIIGTDGYSSFREERLGGF